MQVTKCDRCGEIYKPLKPEVLVDINQIQSLGRFLNCSRLVMINKNKDYDLCEKCTEEILKSFKGE